MGELKARDVMTTNIHTVPEDTSLEEIAKLLAAHHISGVPVVDAEGNLVGIVSEADLIDEHKRDAHIPRVALYGLFTIPEEALKKAFDGGKRLKARDVMTKRVITDTEDRPVHELADLMMKRRINRVPIVRDGKVVGIVTRGDLVRAMAEGRVS
jgi:CBS domain-containing protein